VPETGTNQPASAQDSQEVQDAPAERPVVLVFGLRPERLLDREGRIDAFLEPPDQDRVGVLIEALSSGLQAGGHVIAIAPEWVGADAIERLRMARSMLDTHRVAVYETGLPPLAATVLASLASACGPFAPSAGVLASMLPALEAELHVVTWLGSVTGLSTPTPSFGQHLASLAPGSAFAVSSFPEPAVHRLGGSGDSVPLPRIERPSRLVVAAGDGDAGWITGTVNAALGGLELRQIEATPGGQKWWGTGKLVEAVVFPVDVERLTVQLSEALDPWVCRWCRELIARSPCPLCGHRGRPARRGARPPEAPQSR
jgi:hypothetical protein